MARTCKCITRTVISYYVYLGPDFPAMLTGMISSGSSSLEAVLMRCWEGTGNLGNGGANFHNYHEIEWKLKKEAIWAMKSNSQNLEHEWHSENLENNPILKTGEGNRNSNDLGNGEED